MINKQTPDVTRHGDSKVSDEDQAEDEYFGKRLVGVLVSLRCLSGTKWRSDVI